MHTEVRKKKLKSNDSHTVFLKKKNKKTYIFIKIISRNAERVQLNPEAMNV